MVEWINIPENIVDYQGFVYEIINKTNGRKYVGKKFFWKTKKLPPLKGCVNKRHFRVESDWKTYWGSNKELIKDIEKLGEENFVKNILYPCKSKFECAYYELYVQINRKVLFREDYYNGIIQVRMGRNNLSLKEVEMFENSESIKE